MSGREGTGPKDDAGSRPPPVTPPRPDRDLHGYPLARLALILALVAFALTVPILPYTLPVLTGDRNLYGDSANWAYLLWVAAPLVGILSLNVGAVARRRIGRSPDRPAGLRSVTVAKTIAWLAAIPWAMTFLGAIHAPRRALSNDRACHAPRRARLNGSSDVHGPRHEGRL
jgi:hypothetical protein